MSGPPPRAPALAGSSATAPLWVLLAACLLLPAALFALVSLANYRFAFQSASQELMRTAEVAREHAARVFDAQTQLIDRVNDMTAGMDADAVRAAEKPLHDSLAAMILRLPQVQSVIVVDEAAHPLASALQYPVPGDVSLAGSDYFKAVVLNAAPGPYVTQLQVGAVNHTLFFGLARRWRDPSGKAKGVVDVAVTPSFFEDFYRSLSEESPGGGDGKIIVLLREDGRTLARYPHLSESQLQTTPDSFLAAVRAHPAGGVYEGHSTRDGRELRLLAYRKLEGFPVYVLAGRNREAVVAAWWEAVLSNLLFGVPATLALVAVAATALVRTRREQRALALANEEIERRERAEAALLRAQRLEAVGQMTGGVAHDFNNLLTVILGSAELLASRADDPVRVRRLSEQIVLATRRGGQITQQLLTFSRRQFLSAEVLDLNQVLREFQPLLDRAAGATTAISLDLQAGLHPVRLDTGHFEAAILNLVGNARDAITGSGRVLITTRNMALAEPGSDLPAGDYVRVSVADDGRGMDAATAAKAFEPFFTTKGIGKGTGLGLSQVYGFAKQAGGDVRITTAPGQGTTMDLLLPREPGGGPAPRPARLATAGTMPTGELVVLVVEDDAAVLDTVVANVRELGYATVTATSADAALALLQGGSPVDLLFTDVMMPGEIDGLQLADAACRGRPGLRVLLTSGFTDTLERPRPPGVALLTKPYTRSDLQVRLRAALASGDAALGPP